MDEEPVMLLGSRLGYAVHAIADDGKTFVEVSVGELPLHRFPYIEMSVDRHKPGTNAYALRMANKYIERICN
jgi:hypothetical protein